MDNFYKLWKHFKDQHDLNLLDTELFDIVREVNAYNEAEGNCIKPDVVPCCPYCSSKIVCYTIVDGWRCDNCDETWSTPVQ